MEIDKSLFINHKHLNIFYFCYIFKAGEVNIFIA